jgi:hypothetical protein
MNVQRTVRLGAAIAIAIAATPAIAQIVKTQMKPAANDAATCDKVVKDYVNTVRFVRQASGTGIASSVEQKYISEGDVVLIAQRQGTCAAADALKAKGLGR